MYDTDWRDTEIDHLDEALTVAKARIRTLERDLAACEHHLLVAVALLDEIQWLPPALLCPACGQDQQTGHLKTCPYPPLMDTAETWLEQHHAGPTPRQRRAADAQAADDEARLGPWRRE